MALFSLRPAGFGGRAGLATGSLAWWVGATVAAGIFGPSSAWAQQATFHLDRLEVPGAPDDGLVLFRPQTQPTSTAYGQLSLGYSLDPLRMNDITNNSTALRASDTNVITNQVTTYLSAGLEVLDHLTLGVNMPVTWIQTGNELNTGGGSFGAMTGGAFTSYSTSGPAAGDLRLDARYVVWRNMERTAAVGVQVSTFFPTGDGSTSNFGGDGGGLEFLPMVTGEWQLPNPKFPISFVVNTGFHFRNENSINDPAGKFGGPNGLGIGTEWRWAIGAYMPLKDGKYRIGFDIFGQTGMISDRTIGDTVFTSPNTPIEYDAEGRMKLKIGGSDNWFAGAALGSRLTDGYGAPDLRVVALIGTYVSISDTDAYSPERHIKIRESLRQSLKDTDGDGIPDDLDACPTEPEDHKEPDPGDGCPAPSDRDGDGIPDQYDKCPDQPEDKDGVDDSDGCPEDDADSDGIPDAKDACPKEPGQPDPDPKKNGCPRFIKLEGSTVRVLQQVHFATGSATILPDSFPMLTEIVKLLQATPGIKKMRVEGHTDNRGSADMNLDLSKRRAASVVTWLVQHGITEGRLESEGYGITKPIDTNDTEEGRQANRRVEFKIIDEDSEGGSKGTPEKPASAD